MKKVSPQFIIIKSGEKVTILFAGQNIGGIAFDEARQRWDATFSYAGTTYHRSGRDLALLKLDVTTCLHKAIYGIKNGKPKS